MKAAFRVTGLAQGASAVNGNYKQAKCVTCPNAVAESLRGHRAQARWLAPFYSLCCSVEEHRFVLQLLCWHAVAGELKSKIKMNVLC